MFVKQGNNLRLNVSKPVSLTKKTQDFYWKYISNESKSFNIVKLPFSGEPIYYEAYDNRTELSVQNHSLLLKNLQLKDTGGYIAVIAESTEETIDEYRVTVEGWSLFLMISV